MRRVVYASVAHRELELEELTALLGEARARNQRDEVSGLLMYRDRFFLQLIEGPEAAISALLARLRRDARHSAMTLLSDQEKVSGRLLPAWRMGFHHFRAIEPLVGEGLIPNEELAVGALTDALRGDPGGLIMDEFFRCNQRALRAGPLPGSDR